MFQNVLERSGLFQNACSFMEDFRKTSGRLQEDFSQEDFRNISGRLRDDFRVISSKVVS